MGRTKHGKPIHKRMKELRASAFKKSIKAPFECPKCFRKLLVFHPTRFERSGMYKATVFCGDCTFRDVYLHRSHAKLSRLDLYNSWLDELRANGNKPLNCLISVLCSESDLYEYFATLVRRIRVVDVAKELGIDSIEVFAFVKNLPAFTIRYHGGRNWIMPNEEMRIKQRSLRGASNGVVSVVQFNSASAEYLLETQRVQLKINGTVYALKYRAVRLLKRRLRVSAVEPAELVLALANAAKLRQKEFWLELNHDCIGVGLKTHEPQMPGSQSPPERPKAPPHLISTDHPVEECRFYDDNSPNFCKHPKFKGNQVRCGHMFADTCKLSKELPLCTQEVQTLPEGGA